MSHSAAAQVNFARHVLIVTGALTPSFGAEHKKLLETYNKNDGVKYKIVRKSGTGGWTTARKVDCLMQVRFARATLPWRCQQREGSGYATNRGVNCQR